jgi:tRNA 2-selenouridine synthase
MNFIEESDFNHLLLNEVAILDVRSEGEFMAGSFPGAVNKPILNDPERSSVGTTYKQQGKTQAIELGKKLVSGETKSNRLSDWIEFLGNRTEIALYCARGGMRSEYAQSWLNEAGLKVPRIRGGYKSLRKYLMELNQTLPFTRKLSIIGGKTGSGKTAFLSELSKSRSVIDLEEIAKHRGSAFGNVYGGQGSQSNFENLVASSLLRLVQRSDSNIFVESESRRIGRHFIPIDLWNQMSKSEIWILDVPLEERVNRILEDYVRFVLNSDIESSPESAAAKLELFIMNSLRSIGKHLGSELLRQLEKLVAEAMNHQINTGEIISHKKWIELLLVRYYDPHYEKNLQSNKARIVTIDAPDKILTQLSH